MHECFMNERKTNNKMSRLLEWKQGKTTQRVYNVGVHSYNTVKQTCTWHKHSTTDVAPHVAK